MPAAMSVSQFCPRCDREFKDHTKVLAWIRVVKHVRKAHPEFMPMIED